MSEQDTFRIRLSTGREVLLCSWIPLTLLLHSEVYTSAEITELYNVHQLLQKEAERLTELESGSAESSGITSGLERLKGRANDQPIPQYSLPWIIASYLSAIALGVLIGWGVL